MYLESPVLKESKLALLANMYDMVNTSFMNSQSEEFYYWAYYVCKNLFGVNENMDLEIKKLFLKSGINTEISDKNMSSKIDDYLSKINN
jgi:hypothetical protein